MVLYFREGGLKKLCRLCVQAHHHFFCAFLKINHALRGRRKPMVAATSGSSRQSSRMKPGRSCCASRESLGSSRFRAPERLKTGHKTVTRRIVTESGPGGPIRAPGPGLAIKMRATGFEFSNGVCALRDIP